MQYGFPFFDPLWLTIGFAATLFAVWMIIRGPRIVSLLIVKYLRKRRITWVSLVAFTLCTAMVIVVISVMGGWLRMFRQSFHGLSGDVLVQSRSMAGFPNYEKMIAGIEALPAVGPGNAVPVISSFGLINLGNIETKGVQVFGYPIDKIGNVNDFNQSLYRQGPQSREDAAEAYKELARQIAEQKKNHPELAYPEDEEQLRYLALKTKEPLRPPSFALRNEAVVALEKLPAGVVFPREGAATAPATQPVDEAKPPVITWDATNKLLVAHARLLKENISDLLGKSTDATYQQAIRDLALKSRYDIINYRALMPKARVDVSKLPGMICGVGVLEIHRDKEGKIKGRSEFLPRMPVKLTVLGIAPGGAPIDLQGKSEQNYWIVDDSRTKVYIYDSKAIYVPFDQLQRDLGMDARPGEGGGPGLPARITEIDIRVKPGFNLDQAKKQIEAVVGKIEMESPDFAEYGVGVQTWEESQKTYLSAIENEKLLMTVLFGLISVVAVFLIFCIFYMIVVEKTRDIGIVKSVGATAGQIAGIFLGYGLAIGLVGAGMGLTIGYLIIHNINGIHAWLGRVLHVVIWNPEVYQFDTIPNTMNPPEVAVILAVAVASAVLGALFPALRAARMHPVEALRWE